MEKIIAILKGIDGLELEVCGSWLWVSGKTKENRVTLNGLGLHYASKKQMWYLKPEGSVSRRNRRPFSMDRIRLTHGSELVA